MKTHLLLRNYSNTRTGAVGMLTIILLMTLVLIFMLTISWQVLVTVKNAKLIGDFNRVYYVTEGGMKDARMQLKKKESATKTFNNIVLENVSVTRTALVGVNDLTVYATGTSALIDRSFTSACDIIVAGCTLTETTK